MKSEVLSVKEKIGYGMGDAASHIIFDNVMLYMMFFYTDIFGIPAGFVGTMFLLARALDAISDPCMGLLADRTRSRWGKFRPWVLFGALPFGVVCVLAYSTPDLSLNGKMIYAAVTYTLLGEEEAVLFARSASVGAQQFPVHWGGDCYANYESMAESLRGGLSIGLSGFGFWSHDIGGFENTAPADVYKRWCAFGLFSSHSRLHGSKSYRVPWAYDEESCDVVRFFTEMKCRMMPYLYRQAALAHEQGTPMLRAMMLEFPNDPACDYLDRQYMLGDSVMVAPVFSEAGDVQFYLPEGRWTHLWHNDEVQGSRWHKQQHDFLSLPVYVRDNTLLALGNNSQKPNYAWHEGTEFQLFCLDDGREAICTVPATDGSAAFTLKAVRAGNTITVTGEGNARDWTLCLRNVQQISGIKGGAHAGSELGVVVKAEGGETVIHL